MGFGLKFFFGLTPEIEPEDSPWVFLQNPKFFSHFPPHQHSRQRLEKGRKKIDKIHSSWSLTKPKTSLGLDLGLAWFFWSGRAAEILAEVGCVLWLKMGKIWSSIYRQKLDFFLLHKWPKIFNFCTPSMQGGRPLWCGLLGKSKKGVIAKCDTCHSPTSPCVMMMSKMHLIMMQKFQKGNFWFTFYKTVLF